MTKENYEMRLQNKVALITGATKGIGAEAARLFAREGARVVICGRDEASGLEVAEEINEKSGEQQAWFCLLDVTSYES